MATLKLIDHVSFFNLPVGASNSVYICLSDTWLSRTLTRQPWALATLKCKVAGTSCQYTYTLEYDTEQFEDDPLTGSPYELEEADIVGLFPYLCTLDHIIDGEHAIYNTTLSGSSPYTPDLKNKYLATVTLAPSGNSTFNKPINTVLGGYVAFFLSNISGSDVTYTFTTSEYIMPLGQTNKISVTNNQTIGLFGIAIANDVIVFLNTVPFSAGDSKLKTTSGAYTTLESDFGKYIRANNNVTLYSPVAADVGRELTIFNYSGGNITLSVDGGGTINGLTTLPTVEACTAYVVAAGEYDIYQ